MDRINREIVPWRIEMISIVVPCYNCEKTFERCIQSIRKQTQSNLEIILVDDGSKDTTGELCDRIAEVDSRIKVIHQGNKGLMNAWKQGVLEAVGEYIIFCDSDDYIDSNLVEVIIQKIREYNADLILYDMKVEYEDGTVEYLNNHLEGKLYTRLDIDNSILPYFFFSGDMQSEIIQLSRCSKAFKRELIIDNWKYLDEKISNGEDDIATFTAVLSANSLFYIKNFYPYHYVRNNNSMVGKYDREMFSKLLILREQLYNIANAYQYRYSNQIEAHFLSNVFLCMKKAISRNKLSKYWEVRKSIKAMREDEIFKESIANSDIAGYGTKSKLFARLIICKQYGIVILLTKLFDWLKVGKA